MEWIVQPEEENLVLDFLAARLPTAPLGYLGKLLRQEKVLRDGLPLRGQSLLHPGDRITLPGSDRIAELMVEARREAVDLLFESDFLVVVNKPAGLAIHASTAHEHDHLQGRLQRLMQRRGKAFRMAPVHRLDLETSGPVLFAKGRQAASELGCAFMQGQARKFYYALVAGHPQGAGCLKGRIRAKGAVKEARTDFRVLARNKCLSLLELELHSGRTHQIRVQLASAGHPLVGDRRYGGPLPSQPGRVFLHCCRLILDAPETGHSFDVSARLPEELANCLTHLDMIAAECAIP